MKLIYPIEFKVLGGIIKEGDDVEFGMFGTLFVNSDWRLEPPDITPDLKSKIDTPYYKT